MFNFSDTKKQNVVGFSIVPGIGLEAVILDKARGVVTSYGRKKVDYNFSQRNIQNYGQFKNALIELINEMKIPPKSYAYLVLPNVFFDFIEVTSDTSDSGIETALTSTSEEFYIFKKEEPVLGWCDVANPMGTSQRRLAYSAFQKSDIDEIKEIFAGAGLQLAGIETAYSSILRGLNLTGLIKDAILMNSSWSALLINTNSYTLFQMEGKNLLDCNEVPLAIKSFSTEEAYQAIVSNASQLLSSSTTSQLYIISQTDDISAEALKKLMQFDREIIAIDSNKYSKKSLLEVSAALDFNEANSMSLSVLGAADSKSDLDLNLNILNNDPNASMGVYFTTNIMGTPTEVTQALVQQASIALCVLGGILFGAIIGVVMFLNTAQETQLSDLNKENSKIEAQIKALEKVEIKEEEIDMTDVIDEVANDNVTAINFYDSISTDIPKNVWLTKYYNKSGTQLAIRGVAESIIDIYEYYKNLRIVSPQSDIKLTELKVITNPNGEEADQDVSKFIHSLAIDKDVDRLYSFVISNTSFMVQDVKGVGYDESDILARPAAPPIEEPIEQPSQQMRPTRR
ncbi:MAG: PilN domain-containing protein [Candidatus Gastranaerophilales bacterium]|nr:PilN domain-containing protein [Candidatus Gastranaerophilales bacterium]